MQINCWFPVGTSATLSLAMRNADEAAGEFFKWQMNAVMLCYIFLWRQQCCIFKDKQRIRSASHHKSFHVHLAVIMLAATHDFAHFISHVVARGELFAFAVPHKRERENIWEGTDVFIFLFPTFFGPTLADLQTLQRGHSLQDALICVCLSYQSPKWGSSLLLRLDGRSVSLWMTHPARTRCTLHKDLCSNTD